MFQKLAELKINLNEKNYKEMRRVYLQDSSEAHEEYKNTIDEYC